MITIKTSQQFSFSQFCAGMNEQYPDWRPLRQVQIAQTLQRTSTGSRFIEVKLNPLAGYEMPHGVRAVAESLLAELAGDAIPVPVPVRLPVRLPQSRSKSQRALDRFHY